MTLANRNTASLDVHSRKRRDRPSTVAGGMVGTGFLRGWWGGIMLVRQPPATPEAGRESTEAGLAAPSCLRPHPSPAPEIFGLGQRGLHQPSSTMPFQPTHVSILCMYVFASFSLLFLFSLIPPLFQLPGIPLACFPFALQLSTRPVVLAFHPPADRLSFPTPSIAWFAIQPNPSASFLIRRCYSTIRTCNAP